MEDVDDIASAGSASTAENPSLEQEYMTSNQNPQFAATASAIRQIFSGGCRMNCRPSGYSGFSGLSGLTPPGPRQPPVCNAAGGGAGTSRSCVCDTCPCALIENVLVTCNPAVQLYNALLAAIISASNYITRVIECGASCQKQAQITQTGYFDSTENFKFDDGQTAPERRQDKRRKDVKQSTSKQSKLSLLSKSSTILKKRKSTPSVTKPVSTSKVAEPSVAKSSNKLAEPSVAKSLNKLAEPSDAKSSSKLAEPSDAKSASKLAEPSDAKSSSKLAEPSDTKSSCPKCMEEGKTCMRKCPRENK